MFPQLREYLFQDIERVKSKFRSYSELKKELRKMEADVKTDSEILSETLAEYRDLNEDTAREDSKRRETEEQLLNFLEYLVHQIDNAQEFILNMSGSVIRIAHLPYGTELRILFPTKLF